MLTRGIRRCSHLSQCPAVSRHPAEDPAKRQLVYELACRLRLRVLPELGSPRSRAFSVGGAGGDLTFAVDHLAEAELSEFLADRAPRMAFYSEDRGLVAPQDATDVLIV